MIDTKALRSRVLDLAIRGKLTEQLPSDGTAEELYQQIQAEKQTNGKIGHNSKAAVFKGDDGCFYHHIQNGESVYTIKLDLPKNWIACTISDISYLISSKDHQIQTKDINESGLYPVISQGKEEIDGYCDIDEKVICEVPILLFGDHTRNVKLIATPFVVGADGTKLHRIIGADIKYVFYWMIHAANAIESKGYARHYSLLQRQCLLLPPLAEQKRIVERVKEIFRLLVTIDKAQEKYSADAESLKAKLITAGIQGKLTEQLDSDGTAEELYQQIQAEKQKLIKEGKIKKEKPLPPISPEEVPFEIPENWMWVRFEEISNILCTGLIRSGKEQYKEAEYYYFKMQNIGNFTGKCNYDDMVMINASQEEFEKTKLEEGDFLFNTRNSAELVGKTAVVHNMPIPKIILNNNILKIQFYGHINPDYINYYFISSVGRKLLYQFVSSTTNVAAIYQRQIVTLPLPLPPLAEQKRIVEVLERVVGVL